MFKAGVSNLRLAVESNIFALVVLFFVALLLIYTLVQCPLPQSKNSKHAIFDPREKNKLNILFSLHVVFMLLLREFD